MIMVGWNAGIHVESTDINVKRTELYCLSIAWILIGCDIKDK